MKKQAKRKSYLPVISTITQGIKRLFLLQHTMYKMETNPTIKKARLTDLKEAKKDLSQIVAVLDIVQRESIETITVKTASGFYDCSKMEPSEFTDSDLADLIIDLNSKLK